MPYGGKPKPPSKKVDYLLEKDAQVIPVEIKSGPTGRMKSMHMFIKKYNSKKALKISQAPFDKGKPILSIPFYGIESFLTSV